MSHDHPHHHEHHHPDSQTPHGDASHQHGKVGPHHHDFINMEDILRRDFELKKHKLLPFLKQAGLKEGQRVLELGCGFAPLLERYCDTVGPSGCVTLTDPEPRLAERLAPRLAGHPNARFLAATAEELGAPDSAAASAIGDCDLAVMVNVYHHLSDPDVALSALRRLLGRRSGRLVLFDFVHDTFRLFVSPSAPPAAAAAQDRLSRLIRPDASAVTALCATRLEAHGFALKLSESYVLQDRFNGTALGSFYVDHLLPHTFARLVKQGAITEAEKADLLGPGGLGALAQDPDAVLFSVSYVMLAADAV